MRKLNLFILSLLILLPAVSSRAEAKEQDFNPLPEGIIYLVPIAGVNEGLMQRLAKDIEAEFGFQCKIQQPIDILSKDFQSRRKRRCKRRTNLIGTAASAYNGQRKQYSSNRLVDGLTDLDIELPNPVCTIGIINKDMYHGYGNNVWSEVGRGKWETGSGIGVASCFRYGRGKDYQLFWFQVKGVICASWSFWRPGMGYWGTKRDLKSLILLSRFDEVVSETKERLRNYEDFYARNPNSPFASFLAAYSHYRKGCADEAIKLLEKAVRIDPNYISAYDLLEKLYWERGDGNKSKLCRKKIKVRWSQYLYEGKASRLWYQGKFGEEIKEFLRGARVFSDNPKVAARYYRGAAWVYAWELNKKWEGIKLYRKALEINPQDTDPYYRLGKLYRDVQNYEKAEEYYKKAIEQYANEDNKKDLADSYSGLGWVYCEYLFNRGKKGYVDKAEACFQKSLELAREMKNKDSEQKALRCLGAIYGDSRGDFKKSLELDREGMRICKEEGFEKGYKRYYSSLGNNYLALGEYEKAEKYLKMYLENQKNKNRLYGIAWAYGKLATCYLRQGKDEEAYQASMEAVKAMEKKRGRLEVDRFKIDFMGRRWKSRYNTMIEASFKTGRPLEAFKGIQLCKSRALLDLLGGRGFEKKKQVVEEKNMAKKLALAKINHFQEQIEKEKNILEKTDVASLQRDLKIEQSKYERLKEDISNIKEEIQSLESVKSSNLSEVQSFLEDFTLIEYYIYGGSCFAAVITKDDFHFQKLDTTETSLRKKITQFREALIQVATPRDLKIEPVKEKEKKPLDTKAYSRELYQLLIKPIQQWIKTEIVYISPDNILNYLPFAALQNEDRYIIEDYTLVYTPSASVLKFCINKRNDKKEKILALGNPNLKNPRFRLYQAENEVKEIAKEYPKARIFLGDDANEYTVKQLAPGFDILHFACHGQLNPDNPLLSCLRLTPDKHNDGYLHTGEVFDLNLNASLVTLSACNTGIGELSLGNEVVGLTRAFLFAGTPSVISTLWNIDDKSTAILMKEFYSNLKTMPKAKALRKAQLSLMKQYPQPFYWSGFCLIGDCR